jgi:crotonobetainyl-CoA:carnitine CoA-transferase CaiB-like acyl-CoA transferase
MDHSGGYMMAIALLSALWHRRRTGEGQWVDLSCSEAAIALNGPALLDASVNERPLRRPGEPHSNRSRSPEMAPHGIYPCAGDDEWVAIACRDDRDWRALAAVVGEPWADATLPLAARVAEQDVLDSSLSAWTRRSTTHVIAASVRAAGVPCAPVARPSERCETDPDTAAWGLWPTVAHTRHGAVRVDGLPVHLSDSDWRLERGGPLLGEHNDRVLSEVLGLSDSAIAELRDEAVIS